MYAIVIALLFLGYNELLIAAISHRSTRASVKEALLLANGYHMHRDAAEHAGISIIFDKVLKLVEIMRQLEMDQAELSSLMTIVLFNPGKI